MLEDELDKTLSAALELTDDSEALELADDSEEALETMVEDRDAALEFTLITEDICVWVNDEWDCTPELPPPPPPQPTKLLINNNDNTRKYCSITINSTL